MEGRQGRVCGKWVWVGERTGSPPSRGQGKWVFGDGAVRIIVFGSSIMGCGGEKTGDCP